MTFAKTGLIGAPLFSTAIPAFAQSADAIAATDLNVRSGPGPQYTVVGVIPGGETAMVEGCLDEASWCQVNFGEVSGWSSSYYLAVNVQEQAVPLTMRPAEVTVNSVTYEDVEGTENNQREGAAVGASLESTAKCGATTPQICHFRPISCLDTIVRTWIGVCRQGFGYEFAA